MLQQIHKHVWHAYPSSMGTKSKSVRCCKCGADYVSPPGRTHKLHTILVGNVVIDHDYNQSVDDLLIPRTDTASGRRYAAEAMQ